MPKYICVTKCYWGQGPGLSRLWEVGEELDAAKCPSPHFKPVDAIHGKKAEEKYKFDEKESKEWTGDDFKLSTKKQINEKFDLGIADNRLAITNKTTLISMALKKQQGTSFLMKG